MSETVDRAGQRAEVLLATVRRFVAETLPALQSQRIGLETRFEADLGLDSLARVELLRRIEAALETTLPDEALLAETVGDLLRLAPGTRFAGRGPPVAAELPAVEGGEPAQAVTLIEGLQWHRQAHAGRIHLLLYADAEEPEPITYDELWDNALAVAGGLSAWGLVAGETVAIMLPTGLDYFASFFGILLAGGVPVPIYPPTRPSQLEEHLRRHARILDNAGTACLITVGAAKGVAQLLKAQVPALRQILTAADLRDAEATPILPECRADDLAFLQYTSGSTGDPKGVTLTHRHLLANIRAMGQAAEVRPDDVFVSWLPLYHDMGLIGAWLGSLYYGLPLVVMSPLSFLARPSRWLWAIHRHRGTLSAAPNFAYELCLSKVDEAEIEGLDLSSWRRAFNGAEPVSPITLQRFGDRFAAYGLRRDALAPVYGLAEAAVGLAFPPLGRGPLIDRIRREPFLREGKAEPASEGAPDTLSFVACGRPLPGYAVRVVDEGGRELLERSEGRLHFAGPSATRGYYRNPEATQRLFQDGWLDTGDRAYLAEGDIYVTGRVKDLVIRGGRNFYPYDLEQAVGTLAGVRKGCVAVFGTRDAVSGSERLVVVAETREQEADRLEGLRRQVRERALEVLGLPPDDVVLVPPHAVLKTSSGKLRRNAVRELYEQGTLGRGAKAVWRQLMTLLIAGLGARLRHLRRSAGEYLFVGYAWSVFSLLALVTWLGVVVLPRARWRWGLVRGAVRAARVATGTPLRVEGHEQIPAPDRPFILVANHASYLDALALIEAVPGALSYVAKRELAGPFYTRWFLERLDTLFVERFDVKRSADDAERLTRAVTTGRSLAFFPEGTFRSAPGLLPFRMGAFLTAVEAGIPVLPVALMGTRQILGGEGLRLRPGAIRVVVTEPLLPDGNDWSAAIRLRDAAREQILRHCGEPDLMQGQAARPD